MGLLGDYILYIVATPAGLDNLIAVKSEALITCCCIKQSMFRLVNRGNRDATFKADKPGRSCTWFADFGDHAYAR